MENVFIQLNADSSGTFWYICVQDCLQIHFPSSQNSLIFAFSSSWCMGYWEYQEHQLESAILNRCHGCYAETLSYNIFQHSKACVISAWSFSGALKLKNGCETTRSRLVAVGIQQCKGCLIVVLQHIWTSLMVPHSSNNGKGYS